MFEFAVSNDNQKFKHSFSKVRLNKWPSQGGKISPPIKSMFRNDGTIKGGWPNSIEMAPEAFSKKFENVKDL